MKARTILRTLPGLLAALQLAAPLPAQLALRWSGGVLGSGIGFELEGQAGKIFVLLPSLLPGPTPLSLIDPGDPRQLEVGLDQVPLWRFGLLAGPGSPTDVFYLLPPDPAFSGVTAYAQALTLGGATTLVDEISDAARLVFSLPGENHRTTGDAVQPRRGHTASELGGGQVWIAGGTLTGTATPLASWELFDPQRQSFEGGSGPLPEARTRHTATPLLDGRVLLVGGVNAAGIALGTTVLFDPATGQALAGPTTLARVHHSATRLADGRVLVVGGATRSNLGSPVGYPTSFLFPAALQSRIFDPATNSWSPGPVLPQARVGHRAAPLPDGRILIAGGVGTAGQTLATCMLFNPGLVDFVQTTALPTPLAFHQMVETTDGRVLVVGGAHVDASVPSVVGSSQSFFFDLATGAPAASGTWTVGPLASGIVVDGERKCIPGGSWPPVPPTPTFPSTTWSVTYAVSGGWTSIDLTTGAALPYDRMMELDAAYTGWTDLGPTLSTRAGMELAVLDDGLRLLLAGAGIGPGGMPDARSEIRVRAD